jgi:hypothetical protein
MASPSFSVALGLLRRTARSSTSLPRCPARSSSPSGTRLSSLPCCGCQPALDDIARTPLQDRAHALLAHPLNRFVRPTTRSRTSSVTMAQSGNYRKTVSGIGHCRSVTNTSKLSVAIYISEPRSRWRQRLPQIPCVQVASSWRVQRHHRPPTELYVGFVLELNPHLTPLVTDTDSVVPNYFQKTVQ